ncbi:MAG: WG repeat-containing protein [Mucinivorans sp.]
MKHIYACILLSLLLSHTTKPPTLYKIEKNGRYGYADSIGNIIIKPIYSSPYTDTLNTMAFVIYNGDIIAIDRNGKHLFMVFIYDNGPDYPSEGLFRIVNKSGKIGFVDTLGNVVIKPQYKFAFPFQDGKAEVTNKGVLKQEDAEHSYWVSAEWNYITNPLIKKSPLKK